MAETIESVGVYVRQAISGIEFTASLSVERSKGSRSEKISDTARFGTLAEAIEWSMRELAKFKDGALQEPSSAP